TVQLYPGDRLMFYSDGFELSFPDGDGNDDQNQGLANTQYEQEFLNLARVPAEVAMEHLAMKLDNQSGSLHQRDDLSVVWLTIRDKQSAEVAAEFARNQAMLGNVPLSEAG
ncbi:MAG TPA: hypothetical protein DCM28_10295, partial [Phycisphaerales bacterium]|nr:hypothetical protein [Phycisphaerales bacterium]